MAQPARQFDDEESPGYEDSPAEPSRLRRLEGIEGGGDTSAPNRDWYKPENQPGSQTASNLADKEKAPAHENQAGAGYSPQGQLNDLRSNGIRGGLKNAGLFFVQNRNKSIIGSLAILLMTGLIVAVLTLLPLKVLHIVQNLQNHFFATSQNAQERATDKFFSHYIKRAMRNCKNQPITKACNPISPGQNPISRLYNGWRNARLEDKLSKKFHLEFAYDRRKGAWYLKMPELPDGADLSDFIKNDQTLSEFIDSSGEFKHANRQQIRAYVKAQTADATLWKRVMYRYKIGRLLEQKYGIRRCLMFCKPTDALGDSVKAQKRAAKLYLVERVILPRNEALGVVLSCFLDPSCDPVKNTKASGCEKGVSCASHGLPEDPSTDTKMRERLVAKAASYGITDSKKLLSLFDEIDAAGGYQKWLIIKVVEKLTGKTISAVTAEQLSKAIPIIGWINLAAQIVTCADKCGPKIKKLSYITNAAAVVSLYAMYRTYADEVKDGKANAREVGSMVNSLGPIAKSASKVDLKGGTAEAEQTPLYNKLFGNGKGQGSVKYRCDGKKAGPNGGSGQNLTCSEEKLGVGNEWFNDLHEAINTFPGSILRDLADVWNKTVGAIIHLFGDVFSFIFSSAATAIDTIWCHELPGVGYFWPGNLFAFYCQARDTVKGIIEKLINFALNSLFPSPFSSNMSGGRTFDLMASGADVSGNDFAHNGQGGIKLTDKQVATIRSEQEQEQYQLYKGQSFFARMFDTESSYSPLTKLAMAVPSSKAQAVNSVASFVSNPAASLWHNFASTFKSPAALAGSNSTGGDAFGIPQYGYPQGKLTIPVGSMAGQNFWSGGFDDERFWDDYCEEGAPYYHDYYEAYNQYAADNPDPENMMPMNDPKGGPNACILLEATVGSAGAIFDKTLLTADDLSGGGTSDEAPNEEAGVTINTANLFKDSTKVACAPGTKNLGIQDGYHEGIKVPIRICAIPGFPSTGEESNGGFGVSGAEGNGVMNSRVSGAVLAMVQAAKKDGVNLDAGSTFRTMAHQQSLCPCDGVHIAHPGYSNHQMGIAIDFGGGLPSTPGPIPGNQFWEWLSSNAANFGYKNYPVEAWHWSPNGH